MLPHVDEFRAVHSLEAVADLVSALTGKQSDSKSSNPKSWLKRQN
jgi:hypothetical protein